MGHEHRGASWHSSSMMHTIISTLLSLSLVVGLAACGGPTDGDLEAAGGAAKAAARKDATCGGHDDGDTSDRAPSVDGTLAGGSGGSGLYLTCWCDTQQGTGDGSGCIYAVASGGSCSGECSCSDICGELQTY